MPECTVETLVEDHPCFQWPTTNDHQKMAYLVYFMAAELAAIGGTNYLSALTTTLNTDAKIFNNLSNDQLGVGVVGSPFPGVATMAIAYNNANGAGAGLSGNIQTLSAAVAGLKQMTDRQLSQAYVLLLCKLGRHTGT